MQNGKDLSEAQRLLDETRELLNRSDNVAIQRLALELPTRADRESGPITVALAGAYSSGKSTLLKALTGNPDIAIGAGITTEEIQTLPWEGSLLIDTPGLHTQIRPEHDEKSYQALTSADLLVFVITDELFDSAMIGHFNQLAEARDKSAETLLVVNKMSRHYLGNSPEAQAVIRDDLAKVLPPAQLNNITFVDAQDAVTAAEQADPARREHLLRRSNFADCAARIKDFIRNTGAAAQQTTPLYQTERALNQALELTDDNLDHWLLQNEDQLRQHQEIIAAAIDSWVTAAGNFSHQAQEEIRQVQEQALQEYAETQAIADEDEEKYVAALKDITDRLHDNIAESHAAHCQQLSEDLQSHWRDDRIAHMLEGLRIHFHNKGADVHITTATKPLSSLFSIAAGESGNLSSLSGVSGSLMHEGVLSVGHFFGKSFHPWEAIKLARGLGTAAAILGPVLVIAGQIWDDRQEAKRQEQMRENRRAIIRLFQGAAAELHENTHQAIHAMAHAWRQESITPIAEAIDQVVKTRQEHQDWETKAHCLQRDLRQLIRHIHEAAEGTIK